MPNHQYVNVHINKLFPDSENFRFDPVKDSKEAVIAMVEQIPTKLYNLTKSILDNGIDPSILPNIVPYSKNSDDYVVMEGNRRITAIKIIKDVTIIKETQHFEKFERLLKKYDISQTPDEYFCALYEDKEDTYFWTYLRHAGELDGEGLVKWDSLSIDRYRIATHQSKPNISYYIINYLRTNTDYKIQDARISTTLKRIIDSSVGKPYYGLSVVDDQLIFEKDIVETVKKLCLLIDKLKDGSITSRNANIVNDIQNWVDRLDKEYQSLYVNIDTRDTSSRSKSHQDKSSYNEYPQTGADNTSSSEASHAGRTSYNSAENNNTYGAEKNNDAEQNTSGTKQKPKKFMEDLAYSHIDAKAYGGIVSIANELSKLSRTSSYNYATYPIGAALLLRALIEQAFKYFLEKAVDDETKKAHMELVLDRRKNKNYKEDPALSEILSYCRNCKKKLFKHNPTIYRLFEMLFDDDGTIKNYGDSQIIG